MSSTNRLAEFPDVEAKLQKPTKKSVFERQKEEAEAKRRREDAETAAVLEDFVKSFDRDGDGNRHRDNRATPSRYDRPPPPGLGERPPPYGAGAGKRHFVAPSGSHSMKSGPGSLGPAPTSYGKKRTFDGFASRGEHDNDRDEGRGGGGRLAFDDHESASRSISKAFDISDDEGETAAADQDEEKAVPKPTIRLSNLPPATSPAVIKALVNGSLNVDGVKILPPAGPGATERKSITAIVTLSPETAATDIDTAVTNLQNKYLGFGFYLSLHRHLSSAAISGSLASAQSVSTTSHPFGAKPVPRSGGRHGRRGHGHDRGFAPPSSYSTSAGGPMNQAGILHVPVHPPRDIKKLRMIHMVVESILGYGTDFEALLMSRPDVQRDEKWAWIWDARSEGGVWYRYKLWEAVTGSRPRRGRGKFTPVFEDSSAWKLPDQPLSYEFTTGVDEFVSDSEYNSSDDDDFDDEPHKQGGDTTSASKSQDDNVLSPLEKAKLVHLLARLPTSLSKLRKGDIARVASFAITHASRGAEEIVDLIVSNVERPFAYTLANPSHKLGGNEGKEQKPQDAGADSRASSPAAGIEPDDKPAAAAATAAVDPEDRSAAKLIGLYAVSDILSSSSTSGIRHAWRYRQYFEVALRSRKVFEALGMVPEKMHWGRLRMEKWKRSVGLILNHWEGWCVFPVETQALFVSSFENPPALLQKREEEEQEAKEREQQQRKLRQQPPDANEAVDEDGERKAVSTVASTKVSPEPEALAESSDAKAVSLLDEEEEEGDEGGEEEYDEEEGCDEDEEYDKYSSDEDGDEDLADLPTLEYVYDEHLDLEALEGEDIDGQPLSDSYLHGVSLPPDEFSNMALEEGEISDDDSEMTDADAGTGDDDANTGSHVDKVSSVDTGSQDAGASKSRAETSSVEAATSTPEPTKPEPPPPLAEVKTIGRFQMSAAAIGQPKKRMRAADLFADEGDSD